MRVILVAIIATIVALFPVHCIEDCAEGWYRPTGQTSCALCPVGFYCEGVSDYSTPCESISNTTKTGSTSLSDCICPAKYWLDRFDPAYFVPDVRVDSVRVDSMYFSDKFDEPNQLWENTNRGVYSSVDGNLKHGSSGGVKYIRGNSLSSVLLNKVEENFTVCHLSRFVR
jgi:hypothetical protein